MSTGIIETIKQAALDAVNNEQMCDLRYGEVVSANPLRVKITNQLTIPSTLLVIPEHLTNHTVTVTVEWETQSTGTTTDGDGEQIEGDGEETNELVDNTHKISGTQTMIINNALKVGDKVALLRKQGGQSYFILDRI